VTRPIDIVFIVSIPVALAVLLAFVAFSGRLPPALRERIERGLAWVFWPAVTAYWAWRAVEFGTEGNRIGMVLMAAVAIAFGAQGVMAIRQGRLLPKRERPAP
jgi:hypothetical protein